jgi:hypothetical protein
VSAKPVCKPFASFVRFASFASFTRIFSPKYAGNAQQNTTIIQEDLFVGKEKIPWHPAFVQALQLELEDYADSLEFRAEYQLTSEPLRIDVVVVKKKDGVKID